MSGEGITSLIPLVLIFVIFYFFLIRPQQKKVKDHKLMVENLKRGDKVVTNGGIVGSIERVIDNDKVEVLISENVKVEVVKVEGDANKAKSESEQIAIEAEKMKTIETLEEDEASMKWPK